MFEVPDWILIVTGKAVVEYIGRVVGGNTRRLSKEVFSFLAHKFTSDCSWTLDMILLDHLFRDI